MRSTFLSCFLGCMVSICGQVRAAQEVVIYVSPTGQDKAEGTKAAPVKTLEAARKLAREHAGKTSVTVSCADGIYYLDQTLVLGPEDSGSEKAPVIYKAEHEGKAVLSGGQEFHLDWQPFKDGIFMAKTPNGLELDQLFVNGERQNMARYPNYDPTKTAVPYRGSAADAIAPERVAKWLDPEGGYIHAMHKSRWGGYHYKITGKNEKGELAYEGGWQNNRPSAMHPSSRMVENIFEELDAPGEWFHNRKTNTLYFYPTKEADLKTAKIEGVRLASLVELRGDQKKPVKYVTFDGFVMRHTIRTFMQNKEPLLRSDWTIFRSGAVFFEGTEDCQLLNAFIDQPGASGVFVNCYNRRVKIAGLHVYGAGASGVAFVGDPGAVRNPVFQYGNPHDINAIDPEPGPKTDNYPMECVVEDALIHEVGTVEKQGAGVQISMSRRITVRDCSIYDTSRAGINIGDGCWGGHVIDRCDVFQTVQETGDHGSFNSWGRDRYWGSTAQVIAAVKKNPELPLLDMIETNVIRNSRWRCDHGWDIDLDDGSSNYRIENNLLLHGGLKLREGYRRTATNNIIVNNSFHIHVWYPESQDTLEHNVVMGPHKLVASTPNWDGDRVDSNLFTTSNTDRVQHSKNGCDTHSVVGDPQFADPSKGDFTVRNEALAKQIGFKNFPMDQFGVKKAALRAIAKTPELPAVDIKPDTTPVKAAEKTLVTVWANAQLVEPKGDALSAYGADLTGGGVAVYQLNPKSPLSTNGLKQGDLIQELNGKKILTIADLQRVVNEIQDGKFEFKVLRNQSETTISLTIKNLKF